ncbi:MAG: hypothetical protein OFPII_37900 [Osedax symbiont Rs1]|nr:MAG: hypothetical protein OFPII_37900 [Osedax symbiont Rs1]
MKDDLGRLFFWLEKLLDSVVLIVPESVTSLHHIAQALDSTAVRKMPAEPTGAAKIFQFHRKTNILHSVFTLKSRIQVIAIFSDRWERGGRYFKL